MTRSAVPLFLMLVACSHGGSTESVEHEDMVSDVSRLERVAKEHGHQLDQTEVSALALRSEWDAARLGYERAASASEHARESCRQASQAARTATTRSNAANEAALEAERMFRIYQALVVAAAQIDAGNFDAYRRWRSTGGAEFSCESVSTAQFRRALTALGIDLIGKDIDHIVPRSLGGADHPSNYQILDASTNRSLGNTWNREKCLAAGTQCGEAIAVSKKCGSYRGPWF